MISVYNCRKITNQMMKEVGIDCKRTRQSLRPLFRLDTFAEKNAALFNKKSFQSQWGEEGKPFVPSFALLLLKWQDLTHWVSIRRVRRVSVAKVWSFIAGGQWRWLRVQDHVRTTVTCQWFNGFNDVDSMSLSVHLVTGLPVNQTPPAWYNESGKSQLLLGHLGMKPHGRDVFSPVEGEILWVIKKLSVATIPGGWAVEGWGVTRDVCVRGFCPGVASSTLHVYPQYCGLHRCALGHCAEWKHLHYLQFMLFLKVFWDFAVVCDCWQFQRSFQRAGNMTTNKRVYNNIFSVSIKYIFKPLFFFSFRLCLSHSVFSFFIQASNLDWLLHWSS